MILCPNCLSDMVISYDNKCYCRDCRKQFNARRVPRRYIRWG